MIVLMGSVGSGKSEQAARLVKKLDCQWLSTSQLLRSQPGQKWHQHILSGELVDDEVIIDLLDKEFRKIKAAETEFILDGAPRTLQQAKWLVNQIKQGLVNLTAVINLKVSDEVAVKRLSARGREDDQKATITKRLNDYHAVTQPLVEYMSDNLPSVYEIDGQGSAEQVEKALESILQK